MKIFYML